MELEEADHGRTVFNGSGVYGCCLCSAPRDLDACYHGGAHLCAGEGHKTKRRQQVGKRVELSKDNVQHAQSKHIDIRHHFICECIAADTIYLEYCPTDINSADLFTKALPRDRFQALRTQLGILPVQS